MRDFLLNHKEEVEDWIRAARKSGESRASAEFAARLLRDPEAAEVAVSWRDLLRSVTDSNHDHVDSLFPSFNRGRLPGTSHRFIAFLARLLRCNLVLSMNFDDLIEQAFQSEKLQHRVFDIWQGAALPDASLLRDHPSLVKLHGGAYGLRVGESLDDPLGEDEKAHLISYLPPEPMLLVLGYAGADRRIMDFVRAFLEDRRKRRGRAAPDLPDVLWIHFEPKDGLRKSIKNLATEYGNEAFLTCRTYNVGAFLAGLYTRLTAVHPTTTTYYDPTIHRPAGIDLGWFLGGDPGSARLIGAAKADDPPVHLFTQASTGVREPDCCSIAMSDFAARRGATHQTLWIDLGTLQSVELVVVEIIRQCRRYDSDLPPVLLAIEPTGSPSERYDNCRDPVARVHEALKRGHYVLVLDNIGAFGRPPTSHHGIATSSVKAVGDEILLLAAFLLRLVKELDLANDSYLCFSTNDPTPRFDGRRPPAVAQEGQTDPFDLIREELEQLTEELQKLATQGGGRVLIHDVPIWSGPESKFDQLVASLWDELRGRPPWDDPAWSAPDPIDPTEPRGRRTLADLLCLLSCFRRPRSLVAIRSLCEPFVRRPDGGEREIPDDEDPLEILLDLLHEKRVLVRQEGETYRIPTSLRDAIYTACSDAATGRQFLKVVEATHDVLTKYDHALGEEGGPDLPLPALLREMARLTYLHRSIASYYYTGLYLPSRDVASLFEYFYHRISSIRYGTSLAALVCRRRDDEVLRVFRRITRAGSGDKGPPDPVLDYLGQLLEKRGQAELERLHDLRAFSLALEREREVLLSLVPSDSLQGWIEWVLMEDIGRFRSDQFRPIGPLQADEKLEARVNKACRKIRRALRDLQGKSLRDSTDYEGCISHHLVTIHKNLERSSESISEAERATWSEILDGLDQASKATRPSDSVGELLTPKAGEVLKVLHEFRAEGKSRRRLRETINALIEIANALRGLSRTETAFGVMKTLESLLDDANFEKKPILYISGQSRIKYLFRKAALLHEAIGGWELKNGGRRARENMNKAGVEILGICSEGLEEVRQVADRMAEYLLYRNYFLSLRARALALRGGFSASYRAFDQALSGLDRKIGKDRVAGAARTLYFSEALMFRSDQNIMRACREALNDLLKQPSAGGTESGVVPEPAIWTVLSDSGRFYVLFERWAEAVIGFRAGDDPSAIQFLRRAITPWAGRLAKQGPEGEGFLAGVRASMNLIRAIGGPIHRGPDAEKHITTLWTFAEGSPASIESWKQLSVALADLDGAAVETADVEEALDRSLAYWRASRLKVLTKPYEQAGAPNSVEASSGCHRDKKATRTRSSARVPLDLVVMNQAAWRHLTRARESLDRAERLLAGGRRDVALWYFLHRTRAEMYFERLLLRITIGPNPATPERAEHAHRKFHEEFLSDTKAGLRSIRRALDCCFVRGGDEEIDRHVAGLRRLWAQFLIVCMANAQIRRSEWHRQRKRDHDRTQSGKPAKASRRARRQFKEYPPAEVFAALPADPQAPKSEETTHDSSWVAPDLERREKRMNWIRDLLPDRWRWINRVAGLVREVDGKTEWFVGDDEAVKPYLDYVEQMLGEKRPRRLSKHSLAARAFVERHLKLFTDSICERRLNDLPGPTSPNAAGCDVMMTLDDGPGRDSAPVEPSDRDRVVGEATSNWDGPDVTAGSVRTPSDS